MRYVMEFPPLHHHLWSIPIWFSLQAKACANASIARLKNLNRRTVDVLASRLYSYYSCTWTHQQPCWNLWVSSSNSMLLCLRVISKLLFLFDPAFMCLIQLVLCITLLGLHRMTTLHRDELGQVVLRH
jgi:26S proteasome regulatory subunit N3